LRTTAYRYSGERLILAATIVLVLVVIGLTVTATVCASLIFIVGFVILSYQYSLAHHNQLIGAARQANRKDMPELAAIIEKGERRIQPGPIEVYVVPSRELNAYTFGLGSPKVVVLFSALFQVMDQDEILFILGHELGHAALGHTWLNSLMGGMAGIPSPFSAAAIMSMAFLWWNRACEYSADRAGLLACGQPEKAVSALVKLAAGPQALDSKGMQLAYQKIDAEDDTILGSLNEALATHPMLIRRIQAIKTYATSEQYRRLKKALEGNQ
jgi:Zn-dependent protease with chaperone function